jgi:hypothetical protein
MNEFKRNLLIVLIAGVVSTYSYGMAALIGEEDAKRMKDFASGQGTTSSTDAAPAPSTTVAPQATAEGLKSPSEGVLPGEVKRAASPAPRVKTELETTVRHGDSPAAETTAAPSSPRAGSPKPAAPPSASSERTASPTPSSPRDSDGYVSASDGRSREGSVIKEPAPARPSASVDEFAAGREQFRARKAAAAAAKPVAKATSEEITAESSSEKGESASREFSGPVEESMLRTRDEKPVATDSAAGVGLSPAPATVTFAEPDPSASAAQLKEAVEEIGGSVNTEKLAHVAQARKDATPSVDMSASAKSEKRKTADGSLSEENSSDSESGTWAPAPSSLASAAPVPAADVPAGSAAAQKDSLLAKIKRNKLKTFAIILALAEAADLTQAFFLKTTKEELQDKTLMQKAKLVAQKTYTAKLLGAAKDTALNLKQHFKTFLHKKN